MKALNYLNYDQLCERWGMNDNQLRQAILEAGLPVYDIGFASDSSTGQPVGKIGAVLRQLQPGRSEPFLIEDKAARRRILNTAVLKAAKNALAFKAADIHHLEEVNPGLLKEVSGQNGREFGRLKREAGKMDEALKAAVIAGLTASGRVVKKDDLHTALEAAGVNIPDLTFRKIWKMLPEKHKKGPGAPKKT